MTDEQNSSRAGWQHARAACKDTSERERLAHVLQEGWTAMEFSEYARSCHRRPYKDYDTPAAYRKALLYFRTAVAQEWLNHFRAQGSKPLPPRDPKDLKWSPGPYGIDSESPLWPFHPEGFVELIAQRSRAYFGIKETDELHANTWAASCRAYWREQAKNERLARKAAREAKRVAKESNTTTGPQ
jgi:hypothetical protein